MSRTRAAVLLSFLLALGACDGGSRGSGITTAEGNVQSVETALRRSPRGGARAALARLGRLLSVEGTARAQAALEGIRVTVDGTSIAAETDAGGFFALRGGFAGDVVIRFQRSMDTPSVAIAVNAPAGGTLTLEGVDLDERRGEATAQRQGVTFDALVTSTNCPARELDLISHHRGVTATDVYAVRLESSSLHDTRGAPVACETLREGDALRLVGTVEPDGTFGEADLTVER
jgi:hypothetical protein